MEDVVLASGYTVERQECGWQQHLIQALIGEAFISWPPKDTGWNGRLKVLIAEIDRVCQTYELSFYAWAVATIGELGQYVEAAKAGILGQQPKLEELYVQSPDRSAFYYWTARLGVHPRWVADGFDLDAERALDMLREDLEFARADELDVEILASPRASEIRAEQTGRPQTSWEGQIDKPRLCSCGENLREECPHCKIDDTGATDGEG